MDSEDKGVPADDSHPDITTRSISMEVHNETGAPETTSTTESFQWTALSVAQSIGIFCLAGVAEIMGGWMVWVAIRGQQQQQHQDMSDAKETVRKPWWYALLGSFVLVCYGFIPCLQPTDSFGRLYAVYGGFFIVLSFLFGWALDGDQPDVGDIIGGLIALAGVCVVMFWPRSG